MLKLSSTQIAVMSALIEAPEGDNDEAQTVVASHYPSAMKLCELRLLEQDPVGHFIPTSFGRLLLKREQLARELDRVNMQIEEEHKNHKPAMAALLRFSRKITG
ncbi:hypothetical protein [Teredinibacter purpureus]|uniref:hypothetical protein n=1 Tax=Teredinibacter purpureus TaxID=2731756 RepID=UPI0005F77B40|nr:hypothetical protein [Teredinibacter purpureus]